MKFKRGSKIKLRIMNNESHTCPGSTQLGALHAVVRYCMPLVSLFEAVVTSAISNNM